MRILFVDIAVDTQNPWFYKYILKNTLKDTLAKRINIVRSALLTIREQLDKYHPDTVGQPIRAILTAPEYFFARSNISNRQYDQKIMETIKREIQKLSRTFSDVLIVPGTVAWKEPADSQKVHLFWCSEYQAQKIIHDPWRLSTSPCYAEYAYIFTGERLHYVDAMRQISHEFIIDHNDLHNLRKYFLTFRGLLSIDQRQYIELLVHGKKTKASISGISSDFPSYAPAPTDGALISTAYDIRTNPAAQHHQPRFIEISNAPVSKLHTLQTAPSRAVAILHNTAYFFLSGKIVYEYGKQADWMENLDFTKYNVFPPGNTYPIFSAGGIVFGIEICFDHSSNILANFITENRTKGMFTFHPIHKIYKNPVDIHLILSAKVPNFFNTKLTKNGGILVHSSSASIENGSRYRCCCINKSGKYQLVRSSEVTLLDVSHNFAYRNIDLTCIPSLAPIQPYQQSHLFNCRR